MGREGDEGGGGVIGEGGKKRLDERGEERETDHVVQRHLLRLARNRHVSSGSRSLRWNTVSEGIR